MPKSIVAFIAIYFMAIASYTFMVSMPTWCANPNGSGNSVIQPLCK